MHKQILYRSTERLTVTANAQNTLQHFQGASAPLPMPVGAHGCMYVLYTAKVSEESSCVTG